MVVSGKDGIESVFLLVSQEPDPGADRFANPVQIVTRAAPTSMDLGLEPSPRLIKLGPNEGDNMERVHDGGRFREYIGGGLLVAGERVHRDVLDSVLELIGLGVEPVGEGLGRTAGDNIEEPCWPGGEIHDDSHPPINAAVGPAVLIDADRGHTIKPGGVSDEELAAEVEDGRAHGVPRGGEVLRGDVDAHLVDDHGLQSP